MRALITVAVMSGCLLTATPAGAGFTDGSSTTTSDGAEVEVVTVGMVGGGSGGEAACTWDQLADGETYLDAGIGSAALPESPQGRWWVVVCEVGTAGVSYELFPVGDPTPVQLLIDAARSRLVLPGPDLRLSPPAGTTQLVQVPTWLWIDPTDWAPLTATATVPGAAVSVTGTPVEVRWDTGDGAVVFCGGPGTPYDPSLPSAGQTTNCSHTYTRSSSAQPGEHFELRGVVMWQLTWSCVPACGGGALPSVGMATTAQVRVAEAQALIGG